MSTWSERAIACPACAGSVRARIAMGAHIGRLPQVRDAVLARTFHRFACPCGASLAVDASFEYTDFDRKQLFLVGRVAERGAWRDFEGYVNGALQRILELGSPHASAFVHGLTPRVVFGVEGLREKLVLADAALDDAVVECLKVRAVANDPSLDTGRIVVDAVLPGDALACLWFPGDGCAPRAMELPAGWVNTALDDRASLEARFPELFGGRYVDMDRLRSG